ncbi:MAG: hypothetical protein AAFP90_00125 [Planctomycetota bacterium]
MDDCRTNCAFSLVVGWFDSLDASESSKPIVSGKQLVAKTLKLAVSTEATPQQQAIELISYRDHLPLEGLPVDGTIFVALQKTEQRFLLATEVVTQLHHFAIAVIN